MLSVAQLVWTLDVNPFLDIFKPELAGKHTFVVSMQGRVQKQSSPADAADALSPPVTDVLL